MNTNFLAKAGRGLLGAMVLLLPFTGQGCGRTACFVWTAAEGPCQHMACVDGACVGACAPGDMRCKGLTTEACDEGGQWKAGETCASHCSGGKCEQACVPDAACPAANQKAR